MTQRFAEWDIQSHSVPQSHDKGDATLSEIKLRPYQVECIETIEEQPPGAYLTQMATGLGKTVTFANIPRHGGRMLILSHREELVEQPRKYFDCSYGVERAQNHSNGEEVVSASVQSIVRRLDRFDPCLLYTSPSPRDCS